MAVCFFAVKRTNTNNHIYTYYYYYYLFYVLNKDRAQGTTTHIKKAERMYRIEWAILFPT